MTSEIERTVRTARSFSGIALVLFVACGQLCFGFAEGEERGTIQLHAGWMLQSSGKLSDGGEKISSQSYEPKGWYNTTVPTTVLAAQIAAGEFGDPNFGMNLRQIPGMTYPIGLNSFNLLPMEKSSPYAVSWWYRKEFRLPSGYRGKNAWLHFSGINYRANIWLNGRKLADGQDVAGAYRIHEFNVSSFVVEGANVLAVEVMAPTEKELAINWVDWNPTPPDKNMGLWGDVYVRQSGPVTVRHPMVVTHFPDVSLERADIQVTAVLHNASEKAVTGVLQARFDRVEVEEAVTLQSGETRSVSFVPERFPVLRVAKPKLWWPAEMGTPNLHELTVRFSSGNGTVSDEQHARVGLREITSELTEQGSRLFRINGRKILVRGAGWAQDMLLRPPRRERLQAEFAYVQDMHLNTIRLEGQLGPDAFFDLADEKGVLVMAGWTCCDVWEKWDEWQPGTLEVATESLRTEMLRMRSHPSLLVWLNGSDGPPPATVEGAYLQVAKDVGWPNPVLASADATPTTLSGKSGVKMTGPYDYEPPSYWLGDTTKYGGGWSYNTETGPGPAIPPLESLRKFLPKDHLWPIDEFWRYHSAGERFQDMSRYNQAMNASYGAPSGLEDYLFKSQAMAYDGERAMFEAYARNKYTSTGVIQWMLNNAWPSTYWHLYDYYLYPAGGYFGTKRACEPLHIQYSYDDRSIVVINGRQERVPGLTARAEVYDFEVKEIFSSEVKLDAEADSSTRVLTVPPFPAESAGAVYFVKLVLRDRRKQEVSSNFYWLPAQLSKIDWDKTPDTAFTPIATFEDLNALNHLPRVRLQVGAKLVGGVDGKKVLVTLHNPSRNLAFQVHVGVRKAGSEDEILPVLWEDNYLALLPGESRGVTARYMKGDVLGKQATVVVDGWNIERVLKPVSTGDGAHVKN
jgi:exo-1,4-beta-D-glucosaminidase